MTFRKIYFQCSTTENIDMLGLLRLEKSIQFRSPIISYIFPQLPAPCFDVIPDFSRIIPILGGYGLINGEHKLITIPALNVFYNVFFNFL